MYGAICGDVIGSVYEFDPIKKTDFRPLVADAAEYTDDAVLTCAVAEALLDGGVGRADHAGRLRAFARRHPAPMGDYGGNFRDWFASDDAGPYDSWGNGSAMRVSPVGWACDSVEAVLDEARRSAVVTHSHPEGVKGAQAVALAVFRARTGATAADIRGETADRFGYDLTRSLDEIRPRYRFEVSCRKSVPEALTAFFEADGYEAAVRNAVSLGGDADTQAAIAGAVAEAAFGGVPAEVLDPVRARLPDDLRDAADRFCARFGVPAPAPPGRLPA